MSALEPMRVLSLNSGSSSLKFALWQIGAEPRDEHVLWYGAAEDLGGSHARFWLRRAADAQAALDRRGPHGIHDMLDVSAAMRVLIASATELGLEAPEAVGHRVVHGGPDHAAPCLIDAELLLQLQALIPWAPLHMPAAFATIDAAREQYGDLPQVACFDTAFHRALPELAQRLPLPRALWDRGLRRYGFHGLSYEYVVSHLAEAARGRMVVAHLGNGASLCALRDGQPQDTSMGFTPTGGIMMGTRPGDMDPGTLIYLLEFGGYDLASLTHLVERESGLLGVSGRTSDVKQLLEHSDPAATQALEQFCRSVCKQVGAYAAVLGGLDNLVFTGGIGEHSAWVRERVCQSLGFLGIRLDAEANARDAALISEADAACAVRVVKTDEARMIARHVRALLRA